MENKDVRVLNRNFSLAEYDENWTKIERYLFIEIYNVIKDFYSSRSSENISYFSSESITVKLPINMLDKKFFNSKNRSSQLMVAAEGLIKKKIKLIKIESGGQMAFDFTAMFTKISYNPNADKNHLNVNIPSEIFEDMIPIKSYCQLNLNLLGEFNSGNTIRLYEIFKSYAFKENFEITFTDLRKKMGFFALNKYPEWKYFNSQVLKPAVEHINDFKSYDIEVSYYKEKGKDLIKFFITSHSSENKKYITVLSLDDGINPEYRKLNMIQDKHINTLITNCEKAVKIDNHVELKEWIISDLIAQQQKQQDEFNFKLSMNAISKQIRSNKYSEPYSHKFLTTKEQFNDETYNQIKALEMEGKTEEILNEFTDETLIANRFGYLLEQSE